MIFRLGFANETFGFSTLLSYVAGQIYRKGNTLSTLM
jgi:hypothetical protein